jgi:hypothetical protein
MRGKDSWCPHPGRPPPAGRCRARTSAPAGDLLKARGSRRAGRHDRPVAQPSRRTGLQLSPFSPLRQAYPGNLTLRHDTIHPECSSRHPIGPEARCSQSGQGSPPHGQR